MLCFAEKTKSKRTSQLLIQTTIGLLNEKNAEYHPKCYSIWIAPGIKRNQKKMKCMLCAQHHNVAQKAAASNNDKCEIANDDGALFRLERLEKHDKGPVHDAVINYIKNVTMKDIMKNDFDSKPLRTLYVNHPSTKSIFNRILNESTKYLYELLLEKAVEVYIDSKALSVSINASLKKHGIKQEQKHNQYTKTTNSTMK